MGETGGAHGEEDGPSITLEEIAALSALGQTVRALEKARARCLSVEDILDRLAAEPLVPYEERKLLFLSLEENGMTADQVQRLEVLIEDWGSLVAPKDRGSGARVHGLIKSGLKLARRDYRVSKCLEFLDHPDFRGRQVACGLLRTEELSGAEATAVCLAAERRPDLLTVQLAARHAGAVGPNDAIRVFLPRLHDPYWQARVIEAIVDRMSDRELRSVAAIYPMGFLWAAARLRQPRLFPMVADRLPALEENVEMFPIIAWALGRLQRRVDLDNLVVLMQRHPLWAKFSELHSA
jgi:hypothetical protein